MSENKKRKDEEVIISVRDVKLLPAPRSLVHTAPLSHKQKKHSRINTPMETHYFVFSQIGILFFSLVFLAGMYWVLNNETLQTKMVESGILPISIQQAGSGLEITSPEDELLTFSNSVIVSGTTIPKAPVIIAIDGATDHFDAIESDNAGKFQRTVTLAPGLNRVEISSFDADETSHTVVRTIYYSVENLP